MSELFETAADAARGQVGDGWKERYLKDWEQQHKPEEAPVAAASIISAEDVMRRLLELPAEIAAAEEGVILKQQAVQIARRRLQEVEDAALLTEGVIVGKNAEVRGAELRRVTAVQRDLLERAEEALAWARMHHNEQLHEFSALKAVARMLEGGRE